MTSEFQMVIRRDVIFLFLTKNNNLRGTTVLYTKDCSESPENGELNFVETMIGNRFVLEKNNSKRNFQNILRQVYL